MSSNNMSILSSAKDDLECKIQCPACLGSKHTADYNWSYSCPWCFETGMVIPAIYEVYWSIRAASQYVPRKVFGDRIAIEGTSALSELTQYSQKRYRLPSSS